MITPKTKQDYLDQVERDSYFAGRWEYFRAVYDIVAGMEPDTILEAGTNGYPLFQGSSTVDVVEGRANMTFDLTQPWPLTDGSMDLFIALQVWEHLEGKQLQATREMMRVCRRAILSMPYCWTDPADTTHYMLTDAEFAEWGLRPTRRLLIPGDRARMIYVIDGGAE